ncbi:MAG: DUF1559 domain-containing protein [Gemmataceae bacterium]
MLVGLFTPKVRRVQEASNRTRSQNNIRQIGVAIQNYHDGHNQRFPTLVDFGEGAPTGHGYASLFFQILPQMESSDTYYKFPTDNPPSYCDSSNGPAKTQIKAYINPADPSGEENISAQVNVSDPTSENKFPATFSGTYATTSYAANGMLFQPNMGIREMKDGTSNTIMLAERYRACKKSDQPDDVIYNLWGLGAYSASVPGFATPLPTEAKYPTAKPPLEQFVPPTSDDGVPTPPGDVVGKLGSKTMSYKIIAQEMYAPGGFQVAPRGKVFCGPRVPQTPHVGGMIVCLGDCATRTITPSVTPNTFWAAVTPAGGETLGTDW